MTASIHIRPATQADRPHLQQAIAALLRHEHDIQPKRLVSPVIIEAYLTKIESHLGQGGMIFVAFLGHDFAGFIACWPMTLEHISEAPDRHKFGYVHGLCVLPACRGHGIAARLMKAAEDYFSGLGIGRLMVAALATNAGAQKLYERIGFERYEFLYEKAIPPAAGGG